MCVLVFAPANAKDDHNMRQCYTLIVVRRATLMSVSLEYPLDISLWPGRFGVGFNSCYHLTDVVSFVSGRNLAIFDPHCSVLPSITAAEPGKRIDFVGNPVGDEYPDQFAPYQACIETFALRPL